MQPRQQMPLLRCYSSRTGTRRNLAALRRNQWGLLVSRAGVWRREGFDDWVGDNGAWADFQAGREFNEYEYERFLDWVVGQSVPPKWLVLPDIVAGGPLSLALSVRYLNRCLSIADLVLIAVQDGMTTDDLETLVNSRVGIFLGGSTEWKIENMRKWGDFCHEKEIYYHVARVNTIRRIELAIFSGATSIDGSNASRYSKNIIKLSFHARQRNLFSPKEINLR